MTLTLTGVLRIIGTTSELQIPTNGGLTTTVTLAHAGGDDPIANATAFLEQRLLRTGRCTTVSGVWSAIGGVNVFVIRNAIGVAEGACN